MDAIPPRIGRYEIKRRIAQGGMGTLYLANDPNTHRQVALKLLSPTLNSTEFRHRFLREVRSLAALSHPNVVSAYDAGEFEGALYFVMEYVDGETLSALMRQRSVMSVPQKLKLMTELCAGLAQAHAAGIIHRDIKPANLMVDRLGRLKILDFGIAHVVESRLPGEGEAPTLVSMAIGTPGYMSPEQIEGREVDRRTDIYAVGAVCHELFSYDAVVSGRNVREAERGTPHGQVAPLASLVPGIDPEIDRIVSRALNRDPDQRYQSAASLGRALEGVHLRLEPGTPRTAAFAIPSNQIEATVILRPPNLPASTHQTRTIVRTPVGPPNRLATPGETMVSTPVGTPTRPSPPDETIVRIPDSPLPRPVPPAETVVRERVSASPRPVWPTESSARTPAASPTRPMPASETIVGLPVGMSGRPMPSAETMIGPSAGAAVRPPSAADTMLAAPAPERPVSRKEAHRKDTPAPAKRREPLWTRDRRMTLALIGLSIVAVLGLVGFALFKILRPEAGYQLTITKPTGGTITAAGIKCGTAGSECSTTRSAGETVEFEAEPDPGFRFEGYTDDCAPAGRMRMTEKRVCGATFVAATPPPPTAATLLTITPPTGGTLKGVDILCGSQGTACSASYPEGSPVVIFPYPDAGYTFERFTGDCGALGRFQMSGQKTCGAVFTLTSTLKTSPVPVAPNPPERSSTPQPKPNSSSEPASTSSTPVVPVPPPPPPKDPTIVVQTPAKAVISDEDHAKNRIKETLKEYCKAIEAFDPRAVQRVYPKANMAALRNQLNKTEYDSVECTFAEPQFDSLDASPVGKAKVVVELKQVYGHTLHVKKPFVHEQIVTMTLSRAEHERNPFLIDTMTFKPKPKK